ncbi:Mitochondrial inner membrane protease subunit 2, variant 3 [Balamuthia mandrillaris]
MAGATGGGATLFARVKAAAGVLLWAPVGVAVFDLAGFGINTVEGRSMYPTLEQGDWVLLNRRCTLHKGRVVVLKAPYDPDTLVIKRITGLQGDARWQSTDDGMDVQVSVPLGHCWLEGDNPKNSLDSREYGPVGSLHQHHCNPLWSCLLRCVTGGAWFDTGMRHPPHWQRVESHTALSSHPSTHDTSSVVVVCSSLSFNPFFTRRHPSIITYTLWG